jgi:hypothetical protein
MTDRALLTTLHQTESAFERQRALRWDMRGRSVRWLVRPGNGPLSTLRNSRDASGPALLFIQAEIGAVVRGVKAGEFDYPT